MRVRSNDMNAMSMRALGGAGIATRGDATARRDRATERRVTTRASARSSPTERERFAAASALPAIDARGSARPRPPRVVIGALDGRGGAQRVGRARRRPGGAAREAGQGRSGDAVDAERRRRRAGRRGRLQRGEKRGRLGNPSRRSFEGHSKKRLRLAREPRTARPRPTVPAQGATHLPALRGVDGEVFPVALRVARLCVLRRLRGRALGARAVAARRSALRARAARRCTAPSSRTSRRRR